jgi:hypothetical protein
MSENCFQFEEKFYKHIFGTSMGNTLSPFIANLFMGFLGRISNRAQRHNRRSASSLFFTSIKILKSMLPSMKIQNGAQIKDGHKKRSIDFDFVGKYYRFMLAVLPI